ncbi:MAG TPA: FG-GAP-like repeat-containing protein [Thermoanaerobaculia bacterium]|nr:FG-GAP-like repeat-containing protein [Thermoanaerobaculia bacterium]
MSELFPVPMGHDANEFAVGDLDNDGETDLVTVSTSAGTINVRLGNGDGTFDSALSYNAPSPEDVAVGDINGDGFADIVASSEPGTNEECISFGGCAGFSVLLNDGDGTFGTATTTVVPFSSSIVSVDIANFAPNDGLEDVLIGAPPIISTDPAIHVFHGDGDGGFSDRTSWSVDGQGTLYDAEAANINVPSGEVSDIVAIVGPGSTSDFPRALIYSHGGSGLQASRLLGPSTIDDGEIATGDFNRDGWTDVIGMSRSSTQSNVMIWVQNAFTGNGGGAFIGPATDLAIADADEDGDLDMMFTRASDDWLVWKVNDQMFETPAVEGSFDSTSAITTRVIANDFNRDGRMDFLFLDTESEVVRLLSNTCTARYAAITLNSSPNPSIFGSDATFTVSVQQRENAPVPTGNVTLYEGSTVRGTGTLNDARNAFITISNLSVGSHTLHAVYEGNGEFGAQTSAEYVHTASAPPFGPPPNVIATGNGAANEITINWTATSDTMNYDVLRRENGGWSVIATVGGPPYVDSDVVNTSAYFYAVRSRRNNFELSGESNVDAATTATLALPGDKKIRATDITTTRSLINSLRVAVGLSAFTYTESSLTGVRVKAIHYTELRDTLNPARTLLGLAPVTFPNTVAAGQTIQRADILAIRNSMQ